MRHDLEVYFSVRINELGEKIDVKGLDKSLGGGRSKWELAARVPVLGRLEGLATDLHTQNDNLLVDGGVRRTAETVLFHGAFGGIAFHALRTERAGREPPSSRYRREAPHPRR